MRATRTRRADALQHGSCHAGQQTSTKAGGRRTPLPRKEVANQKVRGDFVRLRQKDADGTAWACRRGAGGREWTNNREVALLALCGFFGFHIGAAQGRGREHSPGYSERVSWTTIHLTTFRTVCWGIHSSRFKAALHKYQPDAASTRPGDSELILAGARSRKPCQESHMSPASRRGQDKRVFYRSVINSHNNAIVMS